MMPTQTPRTPTQQFEALTQLALDLRWTWSHGADALWRMLDQDVWERTKNPWTLLQNCSQQRLQKLSKDSHFCQELDRLTEERAAYHADEGWYGEHRSKLNIGRVAYFSMEFGLGEALPIYAGGLGILAGDYLKAASDLGLPVIGIGMLYQEGYFRQMIDAEGQQLAVYPYNEPSTLPIQPARTETGEWLHIPLNLPGRVLMLRVWQVNVGRVTLYLLDSNDLLNSPSDRGITSKLYGSGKELRFLQEMVLGIGGWRLLEAIGDDISVCHLNEGHAAFVILERARQSMEENNCTFEQALWHTRAGNVFTTHTPVEAGFDTFPAHFIDKYFPLFHDFLIRTGLSLQQLLALGRKNADDPSEAFNMAYLAMRGCARSNGVSRLHGQVSRNMFSVLYPRWPVNEVPISHVTNGVHVPSWDSPWADKVWTDSCGKQRWLGSTELLDKGIGSIEDSSLWTMRANQRTDLIQYARQRLAAQLGQAGATPKQVEGASQVLDPNALTLGFAKRFATYKRPNLLLHDKARMSQLLKDNTKPVQLIIAGKAHPNDIESQHMIQEWILFVNQNHMSGRVVFLEDYDIELARHLVQGIDVWINTPRRPWEACGTSGMKILVNGGLNLSELDGWWAEACHCDVGWSIGDGKEHNADLSWDAVEAEQLYQLLENEIIPLFFKRDEQGLPREWLKLIRNSMMTLAPQFSSNRMVQEYVERFYFPAATDYAKRNMANGELAKQLSEWHKSLTLHWGQIHFGNIDALKTDDGWAFQIQVYLGEILPDQVRVELYAEESEDEDSQIFECDWKENMMGSIHGYTYHSSIKTTRLSTDFTMRIVPGHPDAQIPAEAGLILWQHQ